MSMKRHAKVALKDNSSPATSYLLSVLEEKARGETFKSAGSAAARVAAAFSAFDEILPHCGIYTPVLKVIREELTDAVYSDTYTTSTARTDGVSTLERVPYFTLLRRLQEERSDSTDLMEEQQDKHLEQIEKYKRKIDEKQTTISELRQEAEKHLNNIEQLSNALVEKDDVIEKMDRKIRSNRAIAEDQLSQFKSNMREVEDGRDQLQNEIEDLRRYKMSYHTLKDTFDLPPDKRPRRGFRRPVVSTKKTQLLSSIEAASKLEQQMIEVQTKSLEEYDVYLEEVKGQLASKKLSDNETDQDYFTEELQLESLGDEMRSKLKNFQRLIAATVVELELVRQHRDALQSQLSQMEQAENLAGGDAGSNAGTLPPSSMAGGPGSSRMMTHDDTGKKTSIVSQMSLEESGLEEDTTPLVDPSSDPFNPQERLLSKYSAMVYTSVNSGKSFDEITVAKFCVSCGEKTAICPHKVTKSDLVVPLPHGCTHIKLSRPMVRVTFPTMPQNGFNDGEAYNQSGQEKWFDRMPEGRSWNGPGTNGTSTDVSVRRQLTPLWQNAKRRAGIDAVSGTSSVCATRELSKRRILSLMEQFYASVVWADEHEAGEESSFREYLYNFMSERYQEEEISTVATYDLITAVVKFAEYDKTVLICGLTLAGLLDGSVARYILLVSDLIASVDWSEVSDFATFAQAIYPSLEEEDLETFIMEYTAYSENKISRTLVLSYIVHLITRNKEPRFMDLEAKLSSSSMREKGLMTTEEFKNAMENIAPLANEQLLSRLIKEAMHSVGSQVLALKRLSPVASYISLVQVWQLLKEQIGDKVVEARKVLLREVSTKLRTSRSLVSETGSLITMSQVKMLAGNISRLRRSGANQSQQSYHDDTYWHSRPDTRDSLF